MTEDNYSEIPSILNRVKFNLGREEYTSTKKELLKILHIAPKTDEWFINKQFRKKLNAISKLKAKDEIWAKKDTKTLSNIYKEVVKLTLKFEDIYVSSINKIISNHNKFKSESKKIIKIGEFLKFDSKELKSCLKQYRKTKDKKYLKRRLLDKKTQTIYYSIESTKELNEIKKLNKHISLIPMNIMRKKLSKRKNYDLFIDIYQTKLKSNMAFLEVKGTHYLYKNANILCNQYYEISLDILAFLENNLHYNIEYSSNRTHFFTINKNSIYPGFYSDKSIIRHLEITKNMVDNFKVFNFLFKEKKLELQARLSNSLRYVRKAKTSFFDEDILLNYVIALETLLLDAKDWKKGNPPKDIQIIKKINDLISYLPEYQDISKQYEQIYLKRNRIVHNGKHNIEILKEEKKYLQNTTYSIINRYLWKKRFKSISNLIDSYQTQRNEYYTKEKNRLDNILKLGYSYVFNAKLFQNDTVVGSFKSKIAIKDYEQLQQLDVNLDMIENKSIKVKRCNGGDKFYIEGTFGKVKLSKTSCNVSCFNVHQLFEKELSSFFETDEELILRIHTTENIEVAQ